MPPTPALGSSPTSSAAAHPNPGPNSSPAVDHHHHSWLLRSQRDSHILTQALSRQISTGPAPSIPASSLPPPPTSPSPPTTPKSLAAALRECLAKGPSSWQSSSSHQAPPSYLNMNQAMLRPGHINGGGGEHGGGGPGHPHPHHQHQQQIHGSFNSPLLHPHHHHQQPPPGHGEQQESCPSPLSNAPSPNMSTTSERYNSQPTSPYNNSIDSKPQTPPSSKPSVSSPMHRNAALSAQTGVGVSSSKVSKRRSRAANKTPITVLSADTTNFRAMVQRLTGIPTSPSLHRGPGLPFLGGSNGIPLLKPHPTRPPPQSSIHGLPTLDTSAFLLAPNTTASSSTQGPNLLPRVNPPLQNLPFLQNSPYKTPYVNQLCFSSSSASDTDIAGLNGKTQALNPLVNSQSFGSSLPNLFDPADAVRKGNIYPEKLKDAGSLGGVEIQTRLPYPRAEGAEQFNINPMEDPNKNVDSWLSFDGNMSSHVPILEPARMS